MNDTTFQGDGKVAYVPVVVNTKLTKQTNADRIRAMTDEELADWIFDRAKCQNCKELPCVKHDKGTDCRELWLDWLKQEVDDDTR